MTGPQRQLADAGGDVQAGLAGDGHRLQGDAPAEAAEQRIGAGAEADGRVGGPPGVLAGQVAVAWTLGNPAVTAAIVGARNERQVEAIANAADLELCCNDLAEIEGRSFIPERRGVSSAE